MDATVQIGTDLLNRVVGMLMHLRYLVEDPETKKVIDDTLNELRELD